MEMTPAAWISLAALAFAVASAILGVWWRMERRIVDVERTQTAEMQAFKLHVAEKYASWDTVKDIEKRLGDRLDNLSDQVMQMPDVVVERILKFLNFKQ